jgi:hypothetical protein
MLSLNPGCYPPGIRKWNVLPLSWPQLPKLGRQLPSLSWWFVVASEISFEGSLLFGESCLAWKSLSGTEWEQHRAQLWKHKARICWTWESLPWEVRRQRLNQEHAHTCSLTWERQIRLQRSWLFDRTHCVSPHLCSTESPTVVSNTFWDILGKKVFTDLFVLCREHPPYNFLNISLFWVLGKCSLLDRNNPLPLRGWAKSAS